MDAVLAEGREPHLHYPAIAIEEVQKRIAGFKQLNQEIQQQEPNAIVRRLYHGTIEDELDYLHLIEATSEHNTEQFREYSLRLFPLLTNEERLYALTHIQRTLSQGLNNPETAPISQHLQEFLQAHLHLSLPLTSLQKEIATRRSERVATIKRLLQASRA